MDFIELQSKLKYIIDNWDSLLDEFFKSIEPELLSINKKQLDAGVDANDVKLPPYQNPDYAKMKGRLIPDLKLTGAFRDRFFVEYYKNEIHIDSSDWKTEKLVTKYGWDIFGVTSANLDNLIKTKFEPDFIVFLNNKLGL